MRRLKEKNSDTQENNSRIVHGGDTMTSSKQLNAVLRHNRTGIRVEAYSAEQLVE